MRFFRWYPRLLLDVRKDAKVSAQVKQGLCWGYD